MNKVELSSLLNKVFTVQEITVKDNPNFVNIRHEDKDILRSKKYALKTKSDRIKKQTV